MQPSTVLAVLAELAPAGGDRVFDVTRGGQPLSWLKDGGKAPRRAEFDRLAALSALHREERILRRGWGFLAGRAEIDGKERKVRVPLLSEPVHLERGLTGYTIVPIGDLEITPLIADRDLAAAMEAAPGLAGPRWLDAVGSQAWLRSAAEATGLPIDDLTTETTRLPSDRLVLVARAGLFVVRDVFGAGLNDSLRSWAGRRLEGTALAAVYGEPRADSPDDDPVISPLPLTEPQQRVVARARTAPVTVVSGPPGNGKSHTVVAAALEVVHRGGSVLVATQSPHAAEVLAGLLGRYPGPDPVLFGDPGRRATLATELTAGADRGTTERELRADRQTVSQRLASVRRQHALITEALDREHRAADLPAWQPRLSALAVDVPGAFTATDHEPGPLPHGRLARWWARRRLGVRAGVPDQVVTEALTAAAAQRAAARLSATGGTDLADRWEALHTAEDELATAVGAAMRRSARSEKRWDRDGRRSAAALGAALRAGRNRRRELLAQIDAGPLVRALPLWIGTVADVEDLLPATPGMFDLVVLDEASHVDQIRAAPVLARARRALIVGDPQQLRFVSFVSDVDVAEVLARHGADDRLDVRRTSAYDLATGAAPAIWLAEHHRSTPHLIDFSARRFYDNRLQVLTRTPATEATDAIDVVHTGDEQSAVLELVAKLAADGTRGIGVISPFRPRAEALESALLKTYPVDRIDELALRVGTVHAFQGSEADTVIVSLGLAPDDPPGRRRFVTDPHLFNVMITRARRRLIVVTALPDADGLLGDFFHHAKTPLAYAGSPHPIPEARTWPHRLAAELTRLGVEVRPGYQVGPWTIDLVTGPAESPLAVICEVTPDHVARQRALHRAGWRLLDAFPTRWHADPRRAALEIAAATTDRG